MGVLRRGAAPFVVPAMLAAKCVRASGLVRPAPAALTAGPPGHIARASLPRRLMVGHQPLELSIVVRIHAGQHNSFIVYFLIYIHKYLYNILNSYFFHGKDFLL